MENKKNSFNILTDVNLTESQIEAIKTIDRPVLVVAVAGSGKTRVITEKIKYLLSLNYYPETIVGITFTNKAANEMKKRIENFSSVPLPFVTTIHSFCLKLLKLYPDLFKINKDFLIADEDLQISIIKDILKKNSFDKFSAKLIRNTISLIKINLKFDLSKLSIIFHSKKKAQHFFEEYQNYLKDNNLFDFGDLILTVVKTLKQDKETRIFLKNKFSYFLVDEYQDTNAIQRELLKLLIKDNNITAVGDEDQSIYSFRGSNVENIMNFEQDFKNAKIIFMEQNFRSNRKILEIANDLIKHNKYRRDKKLIPYKKDEGEIYFFREYSEKHEAKRVINIIKNCINDNYNFNEIAILYRANWQSAFIEQELLKNNIPYKIFHGISFYKRKEIKTIFYYIGYILNLNSLPLLKNIINIPKRGIGEKTFEKIESKFFNSEEKSLLNTLLKIKNKNLKNFVDQIKKLHNVKSPSKLINLIVNDFNLLEYFKKDDPDKIDERIENIKQLEKIANDFENNDNYLKELNINPVEEFYNQFILYSNENPLNRNGVNLLTLHSAKGLEFPIVIITGLVDGIMPLIKIDEHEQNNFSNIDDFEIKKIFNKKIEEERRLFYVGITRAKEKLYLLSYYYQSGYFGGINKQKNLSPFLLKIPKKHFTMISNYYSYKYNDNVHNFSSTKNNEENIFNINNSNSNNQSFNNNYDNIINDNGKKTDFKIGDKVIVSSYGKGVIIEIQPLKKMTKLTIKFENNNTMMFIKEYAKIEKINKF